jgi:hypothetical protein
MQLRATVGFFLIFSTLFTVPLLADDPPSPDDAMKHVRERAESLRKEAERLLDRVDPDGPHKRIIADVRDASSRLERAAERIDTSIRTRATELRTLNENAGPCRDETTTRLTLPDPPSPPSREELSADARAAFDRLRELRNELHASTEGAARDRDFAAPVRMLADRIDAVLDERATTVRRAEWLERVGQRLPAIPKNTPPCEILEDLMRPLENLPDADSLRRFIRNPGESLSAFHEENKARLRGRVERRMDAVNRGRWGVGVGTIWTPLDDERYALVPTGVAGNVVVQRVSERNRSGLPVLMVNFQPPEDVIPSLGPIRPAVEVGTSLDFDRAGFFVGGALDIGPLLRIGVGYTAQQVETLSAGLHEGSVVPFGQPLSTRDEFEGDIYVSFTLALDRFELFRLR